MEFKKDILFELTHTVGGIIVFVDSSTMYGADELHIRFKVDPSAHGSDVAKKGGLRTRINSLAKQGLQIVAIEQSGSVIIWDFNLVFKRVEGVCTGINSRMCPTAII